MGLKIRRFTMTAMISKVNPPQQSKNGGTYQKIEMITQPDNIWCYTYVDSSNFNFERWEKVIEAPQGIWVTCLEWYDEIKKQVDADSKVVFHNRKYEKRNPIAQLTLGF